MKRLLVILGTFTLLAACSSRNQEVSQTTSSPAATSPATTQAPTNQARKKNIEVQLTDFKINMPASLPAGKTTFKVKNAGKVIHNFEIQGNGIAKKFASNLKPGETNTLQVNLKPGTYKVYCPVASHESMGMVQQLKVVSQ